MKTSDLRSKFSMRFVNERPEISTVYVGISAYLRMYICKHASARFGDFNGMEFQIAGYLCVGFNIQVNLSYIKV